MKNELVKLVARLSAPTALLALFFCPTLGQPAPPPGPAASMAPVMIPQDYRCKNAGGCIARRSKNGKLESVRLRKGDLVSTEDGWIVDPDDGWEKEQSGPTVEEPKTPPMTCTQCHPWPFE